MFCVLYCAPQPHFFYVRHICWFPYLLFFLPCGSFFFSSDFLHKMIFLFVHIYFFLSFTWNTFVLIVFHSFFSRCSASVFFPQTWSVDGFSFIADKSHAGRFVIFLAFWLCVVIVESMLLSLAQSQIYGQKASGIWHCHCKHQFFSNTEGETNLRAMAHLRAVKKPPSFKGPETPKSLDQ